MQADEYFQGVLRLSLHKNEECTLKEELEEGKDELEAQNMCKVIFVKPDTKKPIKAKKDTSQNRYRPICGYCGKEQESYYRLRQHELLSHTSISQLSSEDRLVCDLCAKIFKTKQSMRDHFIRAHTPKTEKFPCSICGKVLAHQIALYAHERVHAKKEVCCQYCFKVFDRKVLLSSHIAIVHLKKQM